MNAKSFMAAVACIVALTACNENETGEGVDVTAVVGDYAGYSVAQSMYFTDMASDKQTVSVKADGEETVSVSYTSAMFGEFTFDGCTVAEDGGNMRISGEGVTLMGMGESKSEYAASVDGNVGEGRQSAEFVFSAPDVMGGTTIRFVQGEMPAALAVAGDYSGKLSLSVQGSDMGGTDSIGCHISRVADDRVDVELDEFDAMGSMKFSLKCEGIGVTGTDGSYVLSGDFESMSGETEVKGSVSGTVTDGAARITFEFTPGAMPMPVTAVFESSAE